LSLITELVFEEGQVSSCHLGSDLNEKKESVEKREKNAKNKRFIKERGNNLGPLVEKSNYHSVIVLNSKVSGRLSVL